MNMIASDTLPVDEGFSDDQTGLQVRLHHALGLVPRQELELLANLQCGQQ